MFVFGAQQISIRRRFCLEAGRREEYSRRNDSCINAETIMALNGLSEGAYASNDIKYGVRWTMPRGVPWQLIVKRTRVVFVAPQPFGARRTFQVVSIEADDATWPERLLNSMDTWHYWHLGARAAIFPRSNWKPDETIWQA
jgi:hypothetical protein